MRICGHAEIHQRCVLESRLVKSPESGKEGRSWRGKEGDIVCDQGVYDKVSAWSSEQLGQVNVIFPPVDVGRSLRDVQHQLKSIQDSTPGLLDGKAWGISENMGGKSHKGSQAVLTREWEGLPS